MSLARRARLLVAVDNPGLVWLMSISHGLNEFFSIIVPPLFPFLVPDLGISYAEASLLVVVFYVVYSIVQLPVGRLVRVYSGQLLLTVGLVLMAAGIAVVAVAPTYPLMLLGMAIAGVGGSTYHPTGMSVISDVESEATHGRSMGIHGMIGVLGPVAAPVVMTVAAVPLGWRGALLVGSAIGVVVAGLVYVAYPRAAPEARLHGRTNNFREAIRTEFGDETVGETVGRALRFGRSPTMLALIGLFAVVGAEVRAIQAFTPVFASDLVGGDPAFGNAMLALTMITAGLASTAAGYGVDTVDRRVFAGGCFTLTAAVVAVLVFVPIARLGLPVVFALLGVVLYSIYPAVNAVAAGASTPEQSGSVFAVTQTAAALGAAIGPFALGVVADLTTLQFGYLTVSAVALSGIVVIVVADELVA